MASNVKGRNRKDHVDQKLTVQGSDPSALLSAQILINKDLKEKEETKNKNYPLHNIV